LPNPVLGTRDATMTIKTDMTPVLEPKEKKNSKK
jgi:hypothetical protein